MNVLTFPEYLTQAYVDAKVAEALAEDLGVPAADPTTNSVVPAGMRAEAVLVARSGGVIAGLFVADTAFRQVDPRITLRARVEEGATVVSGEVLASLGGPLRGLLSGERVALNFLQRLSGIASLTRRYVDAVAVEGSRAAILDTRKTGAGLRPLERYAVAAGGGVNHRYNLAAGVLVKDNHVQAAGGVSEAVARVRAKGLEFELEVDTLGQLETALGLGVDRILLDNFTVDEVTEAVRLAAGRAVLEVSGGVGLDSVGAYARTGVDRISVGALTHSAPALDISMEVQKTWSE